MKTTTIYVTDPSWQYLLTKAGLPHYSPRQNAKGISSWFEELLTHPMEDTRPEWKATLPDQLTTATIDNWIITPHIRRPRLLTMSLSAMKSATSICETNLIIPKQKTISAFLGAVLECVGSQNLTPQYDDWPPPIHLSDSRLRNQNRLILDDEHALQRAERYLTNNDG